MQPTSAGASSTNAMQHSQMLSGKAIPTRWRPAANRQYQSLIAKPNPHIAAFPRPLQCNTSRIALKPCSAMFYGGGLPSPNRGFGNFDSNQGFDRVAAAPPAGKQALLSNAITSCRDWRQLNALVDRYGRYLTVNNVSHILTRLEQLLAGRQLSATETLQVESLLEWLLARGRELNASAQLGPQALGATAGALARLQAAQRRQQQQQQLDLARQQRQRDKGQQQQQAEEEQQRKRAAAVERHQLLQQLVDAAVAQRGRLSPQALNSILSALAGLEESGMSADDIRQLLKMPVAQPTSRSNSSSSGIAAPPLKQASLQQQQQQQRDLPSAARQLGQLSPELAQEWYDRALRQSLNQGTVPAGIDQRYISGFLAREIDRAVAKTRDSSGSSSSSASGAVLLGGVLQRYRQLIGAGHLALAGHRLAELQQEGLAGGQQDVEAVAGLIFQLYQQRSNSADAAALTSIISSCKDLKLYSKTLVSAVLTRAKTLLQQQLQGLGAQGEGFSGRQLGVLLHSLAVLGLKPGDAWLRLAVMAAGELIPTCTLTELERLASSLLLMGVQPGPTWTAAAEQHLQQLAAAIGSSSSSESSAVDQTGQQASEEGYDARKTLVACVKALALLGSERAEYWYRSILAHEEQKKLWQQQQQEEEEEEDVESRRQSRLFQQQQQQQAESQRQQQQQRSISPSEHQLTQQLRKAVAQGKHQQQQKKQVHLHPHHHLQHRHRNHQHAATASDASSSSSSSSKSDEMLSAQGGVPALSSLDDLMSQQLLQQQPDTQSANDSSSSSKSTVDTTNAAAAAARSALPSLPTTFLDADGSSSTGKSSSGDQAGNMASQASLTASEPGNLRDQQTSSTGRTAQGVDQDVVQGSMQDYQVESAAPAAWADEQSTRWASTESQHLTPASELQQQLDDSNVLFGSSKKKSSSAASQQQQQDVAGSEIPVIFEEATASSSSSSKEGQPQQQRRSDADAASALAALMAEVDAEQVDESAQQDVLRELGLGPDGTPLPTDGTTGDTADTAAAAVGGAGMTVSDIQAAADAAKEAAQQLEELQQRQQQQQEQEQSASRRHKHHREHKEHKHDHTTPAAPAAAKLPEQQQQQQQQQQRPLGSSCEPAFTAAAKNLSSSKPSRAYLLGCLEAIDMQQNDLKRRIAEKQALAAVADAARQQRQQAAVQSNPLAKKIQQLQQDFDRARKRFEDEKSGVRSAAVAEVVEKLLPLLDSFDAALAARQQQQESGIVDRDEEQIHLVYQGLNAQLLSLLKSHSVTIIGEDSDSVVGSSFDPAHMEAVMRQPAPAGFSDGDVLRVLRKGYSVGDKLVRAALVVVAYED